MDRIRIIKPDGSEYEVHSVPLGACPYLYGGELVRHHGKNFSYQVEISGEIPKRFTAEEIVAHAFLRREFGDPDQKRR